MRRMLVAVVGGIAILAMGCGDSSSKSGSGTKDDTGGGQTESDTTAAPGDDTTAPPIEDTSVTPPPEDTAVEEDKGVTPPPDVDKPKEDTTPPDDDKIVTCGAAYACIAAEKPTTQATYNAAVAKCTPDLPKTEVNALDAYGVCQQSCVSVPAKEQTQCLIDKCFDELHTCLVGGEGSENCSFIVQCIQGCGQDQACLFDCMKQASKESVKLQLGIEACAIEVCGAQPTQACLIEAQQGACKDAVDACLNDGKAPGSKPGVLPTWVIRILINFHAMPFKLQ